MGEIVECEVMGPLLRPIVKPKPIGIWNRIKRWWSRGEWELMEDYALTLPGRYGYDFCEKKDYTYCVKKGFKFDGASVPRLFWIFISPTDTVFIASMFHDYAYRKGVIEIVDDYDYERPTKIFISRKSSDALFRDLAIEISGLKIIPYIAWAVVRVFGVFSFNR